MCSNMSRLCSHQIVTFRVSISTCSHLSCVVACFLAVGHQQHPLRILYLERAVCPLTAAGHLVPAGQTTTVVTLLREG